MKVQQFVDQMMNTREYVDIGITVETSSLQKLMPFVHQKRYIMQKALFGIHNNDIVFMQHSNELEILPHSHDFIEIQYISSGCIQQVINGSAVDLHKGSLTVFNKDTVHSIAQAKPEARMDYIFIHERLFDMKLFSMIDRENKIIEYILSSLHTFANLSNYLYFNVCDDWLDTLFDDLRRETKAKQYDYKHLQNLLLSELFIRLGRLQELNMSDARPSTINRKRKLLMEVDDYVRANYRNASLDDLAQQLHLNPSYLCRTIREMTSKTFSDLICDIRLEAAESLLVYSDLPIESIAMSLGYSNPVFFYKLFRRKHNMTPKDFRSTSKRSVVLIDQPV